LAELVSRNHSLAVWTDYASDAREDKLWFCSYLWRREERWTSQS
jgi:hypothetical protein